MTGWIAAIAAAAALAVSRGPAPARRLRSWRSAQSQVRPGVARPLLLALAVVAAGAGIAAGVPPVAVGAMAVAGVTVDAVRRRQLRARVVAQRATAVVEIAFALAGELRAGRTPAESLAAVSAVAGPLAEPVSMAHRCAASGGSAADVLGRAAALPGADRLRPVASAWRVAETAGGRVAPVLERVAEAMDADLQLRQELDAALAGPRATVLLLAALPAVGMLLGQAMGANPLHLLLFRPIGWGLLTAAVGLDVVGVWLLRRITASASRC